MSRESANISIVWIDSRDSPDTCVGYRVMHTKPNISRQIYQSSLNILWKTFVKLDRPEEKSKRQIQFGSHIVLYVLNDIWGSNRYLYLFAGISRRELFIEHYTTSIIMSNNFPNISRGWLSRCHEIPSQKRFNYPYLGVNQYVMKNSILVFSIYYNNWNWEIIIWIIQSYIKKVLKYFNNFSFSTSS